MTRDIYIRTKSYVRRYPLGKNVRPLTIVTKRLFRTDDALMVSDTASDHQFVMYDIDQTQPYFYGMGKQTMPQITNPDLTMAYIDAAKQGARSSVSRIGWLTAIPASYLMYGAIGIIVIYAVIIGGLR